MRCCRSGSGAWCWPRRWPRSCRRPAPACWPHRRCCSKTCTCRFAQIVNAVLPVGLRGLVLAAALAAIMSTASACLLAASTVLLEDVYLPLRHSAGRGAVGQSRAVTLLLGLVMTILSCRLHDVFAALTVAYDL